MPVDSTACPNQSWAEDQIAPTRLFPRNTLLRQIHETQRQASPSQQQATEILDTWKNGLKGFPNQKLIIHSRCKTRLPLHRALWREPGREEVFSPRYRMREALRKSRQTYSGKMVKGAQGRVDEDHTGETDTQIQRVFCCQYAASLVLCDWTNNPHTHRKKSTSLVHKHLLP